MSLRRKERRNGERRNCRDVSSFSLTRMVTGTKARGRTLFNMFLSFTVISIYMHLLLWIENFSQHLAFDTFRLTKTEQHHPGFDLETRKDNAHVSSFITLNHSSKASGD